MQKIDLDAMSIDELAKLRDNAGVKLAEKVNARRKELEAELARLSIYGKGGKTATAVAPKLVKENVRELSRSRSRKARRAPPRRLEPPRIPRDMRSPGKFTGALRLPFGSRTIPALHADARLRDTRPDSAREQHDCARS